MTIGGTCTNCQRQTNYQAHVPCERPRTYEETHERRLLAEASRHNLQPGDRVEVLPAYRMPERIGGAPGYEADAWTGRIMTIARFSADRESAYLETPGDDYDDVTIHTGRLLFTL